MATTLTRDTIIQYAGKRAGNESLTTFAADWLNNIIDTLAQNYKFPDLQKIATGTLTGHGTTQPTSVDVISLPADYGDLFDVHSLSIVDVNGNHDTLDPEDTDWYDTITAPLTLGKPSAAIFNLNAMTWTPYPLPQQTYTWQLRYRYKPSRLSSNSTIPFASDEIFIQALYVQILQYEDDARYPTEYAALERLIAKYIGGFNKSPNKDRQIRLNRSAFLRIQSYR